MGICGPLLRAGLFGIDGWIFSLSTATKTNRVHEPPTWVGGWTVTRRHVEISQHFRLLLDIDEVNSVLFVYPPTGVGGSKLSFYIRWITGFRVVAKAGRVSAWESVAPYCVRGSSVLMGGSFSRRPQPKLIVFMSPQRELEGAQSLVDTSKFLNIFGYC